MSVDMNEVTVEAVMAQIANMTLSEKWQIVEQTQNSIKAEAGVKSQKQKGKGQKKRVKKERDPDAPKKEPSEWIKHTSHCRQFLPKEAQGVPCTQIASMLKADGKMFPDEADIMEAFESWKLNPPAKKAVVKKAAKKTDSDSDSEEPKKERKKRAPMSDEAKAAAKAKREAKKAAEAAAEAEAEEAEAEEAESSAVSSDSDSSDSEAEATKPAKVAKLVAAPVEVVVEVAKPVEAVKPKAEAKTKDAAKAKETKTKAAPVAKMEAPVVVAAAAVEEEAVEGETKEYKIGKKAMKYDCFPDTENKGCEYLYANDTGVFAGRYNTVTKKLDSTVADPAA